MEDLRPRPWHPFHHPGMCGLRGTLCCILMISALIVGPILLWGPTVSKGGSSFDNITLTKPTYNRSRRALSHMTLSPEDPYNASWSPDWLQRNWWMQYVNDTARTMTDSSCLICAGHSPKAYLVGLPETVDC